MQRIQVPGRASPLTEPLDPEFERTVTTALRQVANRDVPTVTADGLIADLGLDSVSVAELFVVLEETLDIVIDPDEIMQARTFRDLQDIVQRLQGGGAAQR
ncbi:MAG: acyl carrier protein [Proteobacteria bacterium]|nr:acyl carrier protein [Pseudomonadota bacterium]